MRTVFGHLSRASLALLPTPLERGPQLAGGQQLWVKRDDLTGLGMGGNKARKLEFLCGDAIGAGARSLVTVGAAQSNHCRHDGRGRRRAWASRCTSCCRATDPSVRPATNSCRRCSVPSCTTPARTRATGAS